jgi:SAM-dependent methyltransferase
LLSDARAKITETADNSFEKLLIKTNTYEYDLFLSEDNRIKKINKRENNSRQNDTSHDHRKKYLIEEYMIVEPLIDLGIFTKEGKIINSKYDKYKQINRFLEIINDVLKYFPDKKIRILDFGCGKSQLTFVVYYFLTSICRYDAEIIGLDLKEDVISDCNKVAQKYGYDKIHFETGNIESYIPPWDIDLVLSLHACDTATDYVLFNAIKHNAKVILSVPCCQHELNGQICSNEYSLITKYGFVKEKISALFTDIIRANLLEASGYKSQVLEFVDIDNTPKNLLIRAVKTSIPDSSKQKALDEVRALCKQFGLAPLLYKMLPMR